MWSVFHLVKQSAKPMGFLLRLSSVRRSSIRLWHQLSLTLLHGLLSNFAFPGPYAETVFEFKKKKWFLDFLRIFFIFVNMGPYGSKKLQCYKKLQLQSKCYSSLKSLLNLFKLFSEISSKSSQKYCFGYWNFEFTNFKDFFFEIHHYTSIIWKTSNRRGKRSEI